MQELLEKIEKRRTFAIISHPDAGKTTLTEKLLLYVNLFVLCIYRIPYFYITCLIFLFVNYSFRPKKSLCQKSLPAGTPGRLKHSLNKLFLIHI